MLMVLAGLGVGAFYLFRRVDKQIAAEVGISVATIALTTFAVAVIVGVGCAAIRPVERFQDAALQQLITDITAAETDVCALMVRVDKFIQGDVGQPGIANPALVSDAQAAARTKVGEPLTECPSVWPERDMSANAVLDEADNRLTRMEQTLQRFTGPRFKAVYDRTVRCDSFSTRVGDLETRLAAIRTTIQQQKSGLLAPIDQKTDDLQHGKVSDCDRRRGSTTALGPAKSGTAGAS